MFYKIHPGDSQIFWRVLISQLYENGMIEEIYEQERYIQNLVKHLRWIFFSKLVNSWRRLWIHLWIPIGKCLKSNRFYKVYGPEHCVKSVQIRSYFWSIFSCIRTRNNSVFGHFSRSVTDQNVQENLIILCCVLQVHVVSILKFIWFILKLTCSFLEMDSPSSLLQDPFVVTW